MAQKPNPIGFRVPVNVHPSVHETVRTALTNHDNSIVDLRQANESLKNQLTAIQTQLAKLQKGQ